MLSVPDCLFVRQMRGLSLDLSAAFDTHDHFILQERFKLIFGVRGVALGWFASFYSDRRHSVVDVSVPSPFVYGLPQGSLLGPILFTLYFPASVACNF